MTSSDPSHYALPHDPKDRYCESHRRALWALHSRGYCAGFNGKSDFGSICVILRPNFSPRSPNQELSVNQSFQTARRIVRGVAHAYGLSLDEIAFTDMEVYSFSPSDGFRNSDSRPLKGQPYSLWFRLSYPGMDDPTRADLNEKTYHLLTTHPGAVHKKTYQLLTTHPDAALPTI